MNEPLRKQGEAKDIGKTSKGKSQTDRQESKKNPTPEEKQLKKSHLQEKPTAYNIRATIDKTIDKTSVDIKGNGYSFPNNRRVTSPGIRPMPIFRSHGQQDDNTITAINVVNSQRIITRP